MRARSLACGRIGERRVSRGHEGARVEPGEDACRYAERRHHNLLAKDLNNRTPCTFVDAEDTDLITDGDKRHHSVKLITVALDAPGERQMIRDRVPAVVAVAEHAQNSRTEASAEPHLPPSLFATGVASARGLHGMSGHPPREHAS